MQKTSIKNKFSKILLIILILAFIIISTKTILSQCKEEQIDINTASKEELEKITQIGKATSERIIKERNKRDFTNLEELKRVKYIKEWKVGKIKEQGLACVSLEDKETSEKKNNETYGENETLKQKNKSYEKEINKIEINTASKEELEKIKGIGPVYAERILTYRKENNFSSLGELKNIKGIGEKTIESIKKENNVYISKEYKKANKPKNNKTFGENETLKQKDESYKQENDEKEKTIKLKNPKISNSVIKDKYRSLKEQDIEKINPWYAIASFFVVLLISITIQKKKKF